MIAADCASAQFQAPISWGIRLASHLPQRSIVTVTTNVPGPREPLYLLGRRIVEIDLVANPAKLRGLVTG